MGDLKCAFELHQLSHGLQKCTKECEMMYKAFWNFYAAFENVYFHLPYKETQVVQQLSNVH